MKQKVLITGSNGLLGQKLIDLLRLDNDYIVIATARGGNRFPDYEGYIFKSLDVCDREAVASIVEELKPNYIIHTAAMTNVDQCETDRDNCWQLNVRSVEYLVEACRQNNVHFIHLSTDFIFDGKNGPYGEDDVAEPVSFYGDSKLAAERTVMKSTIKWTILRTVLVYGIVSDMSRSNIILWVKKSLEENKTITVVDDQWRTPTLAEDLAKGCMLAMKNKATGVFNISGKDFLSPYEMAMKTVEYFGLNKNLIVRGNSSTFKQPAQRPPKTGFIIDKAVKQLGYAPVSFEQGIEIVANQLKELETLV